jgi:GT2 family glycosyltransferase
MTTQAVTTTPPILIIIVTWNNKASVLELLASLATLAYPIDALDILVVDNASQDGTKEAIEAAYPQVNLIYNQENLGGTGGFNTGLQWAFEQDDERYQYLWLLDNDVLVHQSALTELVALLEAKPDIAVAGSTMMQLDYPWRINEMGAFIDRRLGTFILNRHLEHVPLWQGYSAQDLLARDVDLSKHLMHCQPYMDVEYVAAASLLIRAKVAKQAGLWRDYFIHFDDVEWCLRIAEMGYRIIVSAKSLIWHLSAAAKVPTWVLYYDNRNVLDLLSHHGTDRTKLRHLKRYILKKAVYYHLIAKPDLAQLHYEALNDFEAKRFGKKNIQLNSTYQPNETVSSVFLDKTVKKILVAWPVNLQATRLQEALVQAMLKRPELEIECMPLLNGETVYQLPRAKFIKPFPSSQIKRWFTYWRLRGQYDLIIQSDYEASIGLSWLKADVLYVNDEGFCRRSQPKLRDVLKAVYLFFRAIVKAG